MIRSRIRKNKKERKQQYNRRMNTIVTEYRECTSCVICVSFIRDTQNWKVTIFEKKQKKSNMNRAVFFSIRRIVLYKYEYMYRIEGERKSERNIISMVYFRIEDWHDNAMIDIV